MTSRKISVIGSGNWGGKVLIPKFQQIAGSVHLAYGTKNRDFLEPAGFNFTGNINQLIDESDAVVVAAPPQFHFELAEKVLKAGKDLLLEKPMALTLLEAVALAELADKNHLILMIGHTLCYSKAMQKFWEMPGDVHAVEAVYLKTSTNEKQLNAYWNLGIHLLAMAVVRGIGEDNFKLTADDAASINQRTFTMSQLDGPAKITHDFLDQANPPDDMLAAEIKHFLACLESREAPLTDGWHGVEVIRRLTNICPNCFRS